jgi:hypothetical protein
MPLRKRYPNLISLRGRKAPEKSRAGAERSSAAEVSTILMRTSPLASFC